MLFGSKIIGEDIWDRGEKGENDNIKSKIYDLIYDL